MKLTFLGSGDAVGSGGRFNTCMMLELEDGRRLLIDCGASSLVAMKKFEVDPNSIDAVIITHLHGDHFGGLPFFLLDAQFAKRSTPLTLVGPPTFKNCLQEAREIFFSKSSEVAPNFDLTLDEFEPGTPYSWQDVTVTPYIVDHFCGAPPLAVRLQHGDKSVAYTGDTQWTDTLIEVCRGADLMIAEAYFFDKK
jgi:ribonuclease BN (tRNA processing enzyme)